MNSRIAKRRPVRWTALVLAASIALAGCVTARPPDLDPRLEAATATFGGKFDYVYVPTGGRLADEAFLAMSRVAGPQKIARDLATLMAPAETRPVRILVTGPQPEKTLQVVVDALSFYEGRKIPHLELLYLGDPAHEAQIARGVSEAGGEFRFAAY